MKGNTRHLFAAMILCFSMSHANRLQAQDLLSRMPLSNEAQIHKTLSQEVARFEKELSELKATQTEKRNTALAGRRDALSQFYDARLKKLYQKRRAALGQAASELTALIKRRPKDPDFTPNALFLLGERLFVLQERGFFEESESYGGSEDQVNFAQTVETYSRIVHEFPNFAHLDAVLYLLGISHDYMNEPKKALESFSRLANEFPKSRFTDEVWFRIGNIRFDQRQFRDAIAAYERVTAKTMSAFFERAQYKLAWSHYLLNEFAQAIDGFVAVLENRERNQTNATERSSMLEAEAKEYLAFSFADLDLGDEEKKFTPQEQEGGVPIYRHVEAFFAKKGTTPWERDVLLHLGDILVRLSKYQGAALAFERSIKLDPLNIDNPKISSRLIAIYDEMRRPQDIILTRADYVERYKKGSQLQTALQDKGELKTLLEMNNGVRDNLFILGVAYHSQAKESKKNNNLEDAAKQYQQAIDYYAQYVRDFYSEDNVDQMLFYLGEALFESERFSEASERYAQVREWPWPSENREAAALNSVYALEREIEKEQTANTLPKFSLAASDANQKKVEAIAWPAILTRFVSAVDRLIEIYPNAEAVPAFMFETANAYAIYGNPTEADKRRKIIVEKYGKTQTARLAADQILNEKISEGKWAAAAEDAAVFGASKVGGAGDEYRKIELGARFKLANEAFAKADYKEASRIYLQLLHDDPKSDFADKILFNAATALQRSGDEAASEKIFTRLWQEFPSSKLAEDALWDKARRHEDRLELKEAAQSFQKFAALFPSSPNAINALLNAGVFLEANQDYLAAAQTFERLASSYPTGSEAPEAIIKSAKLYGKAHDSAAQIRVLETYIKRYRRDPQRLESVIGADVMLGDVYFAQSRSGKTGEWAREQGTAAYKDAIALFQQIPQSPVAAYYVAKSKSQLLNREFEEFGRMKIAAQLGKNQANELTQKTSKLADLKKRYEEIIRGFAGSEWSVLALQRVGALYEGLYRSLLDAPCPRDVERVDETACDEYKSLLEDKAFILEEKAIESYELAIKQASNVPNASKTVFLAAEALNRMRPDKFAVPEQPLNPIKVGYFEDTQKGSKAEKGKTFYEQGKWEAAQIAFEDMIAADAKNAIAHLWLGHTLMKLTQPEKAFEHYEKATSLRPDIAEAQDSLGILLLEKGNAESAREAFAHASRLAPDSALYALHLGSAHFQLKNWGQSLAEYTRAQKIDNSIPALQFNFGLVYWSGSFTNIDDLSRWQLSRDSFAKYLANPDLTAAQKNRVQFFMTSLEQKIFIEKQRREREQK